MGSFIVKKRGALMLELISFRPSLIIIVASMRNCNHYYKSLTTATIWMGVEELFSWKVNAECRSTFDVYGRNHLRTFCFSPFKSC